MKSDKKLLGYKNEKEPVPANPPAGGFEMSLVLTMGDQEMILNGQSFSDGIYVNYSRPWKEAIDLGPVGDALAALGGVLGLGDDLKTKIDDFVNTKMPKPLQGVAKAFFSSHIIVTDLIIDTRGTDGKDTYTFGLGLVFSENPPKVGNVALQAFLLKYTYSKDHPAA